MLYRVKFYRGDYKTRQEAANRDGAVAYVEHHFNAGPPSANYSMTIIGSNGSMKSQEWGLDYTKRVSEAFKTRDFGVIAGGFEGRGDGSLKYTWMPAILVEPLFASNPEHAAIIRSDEGQTKLAELLVESIKTQFPEGGLIAFSVGHKYKRSRPADRGAEVVGGGMEADFAEVVLQKAALLLENDGTGV